MKTTTAALIAGLLCGTSAAAYSIHGIGPYRPPLAQKFYNYPQSSNFFPITIWYQIPGRTGASDNASYANEATGSAAIGVNIMAGIGPTTGSSWPQGYGSDAGEMAIMKAAGLYVIAGGPDFGNHRYVTANLTSGSSTVTITGGDTISPNINGEIVSGASLQNYPPVEATYVDPTHFTMFIPAGFGASSGVYTSPSTATGAALHIRGDFNSPTTAADSVSSIIALATSKGALSNLIGYMGPDEPPCNSGVRFYGPFLGDIPGGVASAHAQDPSRPVLVNFTNWPFNNAMFGSAGNPNDNKGLACTSSFPAAMQASDIGSTDFYPITGPFNAINPGALYVQESDYSTHGRDVLWQNAVSVYKIAAYKKPGDPVWVYLNSGGDDLGSESGNSNFTGSVVSGSTTLTVESASAHPSTGFNGLTVTDSSAGGGGGHDGIPAGTTITYLDATHFTMSNPATVTATAENIQISGGIVFHGVGTACIKATNVCLIKGNQYRETPAQVTAEVWNMVIAGATGIEWFCQDGISQAFCMGGNDGTAQGAADAQIVVNNLKYIDGVLAANASLLNSPVTGKCDMDFQSTSTINVVTSASCSNGNLTMAMASGNTSCPGLALAHLYNGAIYLMAQSNRNSIAGACTAAGGAFNFTLAGLGGQTATVVYDSNAQYDPTHSSLGATFTLSGAAQFTDTLGVNGNSYQAKIYRVQ